MEHEIDWLRRDVLDDAEIRPRVDDELLDRVLIGGRQPARILIVDYDPAWPLRYERERARIGAALKGRARRIEHVGSTSVPGIAAKPRIDILLVVEDPSAESTYVPALEAAGYVLHSREPDWYQHRMLTSPEIDLNLHVLPAGCAEIDRMLRFRDHLRQNEADRQLYERTKRQLAQRHWTFMQDYADAKSQVVEEIIARALENTESGASSG